MPEMLTRGVGIEYDVHGDGPGLQRDPWFAPERSGGCFSSSRFQHDPLVDSVFPIRLGGC